MVALEYAKKYINLVELAVNKFGYKIKKDKSSRYYKTLKKDGDIIVVSRNMNNEHWIYFNTRDDNDNGTIIDFIQNRTGYNLGEVRRFLSEYLKEKREGKIKEIKDFYVEPSQSKDIKVILSEIEKLSYLKDENYLVKERKIGKNILKNFNIYQDKRNNVVFILYDELGYITGLAKYNKNFKQILGSKGVWSSIQYDVLSNKEENLRDKVKKIEKIFITESPIDALSYLELKEKDNIEKVLLLTTQGQISDRTIEILFSFIKAIYLITENKNLNIVLGFDRDEKGLYFATEVNLKLKEKMKKTLINGKEPFPILDIKIKFPETKDWNEDLKLSKKPKLQNQNKKIKPKL